MPSLWTEISTKRLGNLGMTWFYRSGSDLGGFLMVNATRIWDRKYEFDGVWNAQRERTRKCEFLMVELG